MTSTANRGGTRDTSAWRRQNRAGGRGWLRAVAAQRLGKRISLGARFLSEAELEASALVVAPHPDDECLGCGGTVIRKLNAGARVDVVFASDGGASHAGMIDPARLRERRMAEARAATARLGVSADRVHFLKHPDGALERVHADLANGLRALIGQLRPAQIFVPHADEPPPDHRAARSAALDALAAATGSVQMLEYPVWWWLHWPWARLSLRRDGVARSLRKRTLETAFGTNTTGTFNRKVAIGDLLDQKRAALGEHVTQMTRPPGLAAWPILAEIAGGDFLNCLLADAELFHAYHVEQGRRRDDD